MIVKKKKVYKLNYQIRKIQDEIIQKKKKNKELSIKIINSEDWLSKRIIKFEKFNVELYKKALHTLLCVCEPSFMIEKKKKKKLFKPTELDTSKWHTVIIYSRV